MNTKILIKIIDAPTTDEAVSYYPIGISMFSTQYIDTIFPIRGSIILTVKYEIDRIFQLCLASNKIDTLYFRSGHLSSGGSGSGWKDWYKLTGTAIT